MRKFLCMAAVIDNDNMGEVYALLVNAPNKTQAFQQFFDRRPRTLFWNLEPVDVTGMTFDEVRAIRITQRNALKEEAC